MVCMARRPATGFSSRVATRRNRLGWLVRRSATLRSRCAARSKPASGSWSDLVGFTAPIRLPARYRRTVALL